MSHQSQQMPINDQSRRGQTRGIMFGTAVAPGRHRRSTLATVVAVLALLLACVTVSTAGAAPKTDPTVTPALTPSCPFGASGDCVAPLPCQPGQTGACPSVDVGPVTNLADGQYVSIKTTNFPATDSFRVGVCSAITSDSDPSCLWGVWNSNSYAPISVPVANNTATQNLTSVTYPVFSDPAGEGNVPLPALDIQDNNNDTPGFFCDNTANPCDIVVTIEQGQGPGVGFGPTVDPTNSVIAPLSFQSQSGGCPSTAPTLQTDGSYSVEQLLPAAIQATCASSTGVVALNTTNDTQSSIDDLATGGSAVAFIDNPQDAAQMAALKGKGYKLVPVAVSATAVSFLAGDDLNGQAIPVSNYNLTPNMLAGLITSEYGLPSGNLTFDQGQPVFQLSDNLVTALAAGTPSTTCEQIYNCFQPGNAFLTAVNQSNLDAFDLLNPLSSDAVANFGVSPQSFGSFMSDTPSGSSYQATDWLCHAPNPAITATVFEPDGFGNPVATPVKLTDPHVAPTTLTTAPIGTSVWPPNNNPNTPWVFPKCEGISKFPSISGSSTSFSSAQGPQLQSKAMRGWAYGGGQLPSPPNAQDPLAAFGIMDSSEAHFYGLNTASLENASGQFVAPTKDSVEAALNAATPCTQVTATCPAGTFSFNYNNADPAAYPMPDITYAVIPAASQAKDVAPNVKNLLDNMINFSTSGDLPQGYYPLPAAMAKTALAEVDDALYPKATPTTPVPTATGGGTSDNQSSQVSSSPYSSSLFTSTFAPTLDTSSTLPLTATPTTTPSNKPAKPLPPAVIPKYLALVSLGSASRLLLPAALIFALACLIAGPLLLLNSQAARRRRTGGGAP